METKRNTGNPSRWSQTNQNPVREGWVDSGGGEARSTVEAG
jgi:hypothetical protein